jgi:hypothetical protein
MKKKTGKRTNGSDSPASADRSNFESPDLSHEEVARLAYSYWEARACQGGSPEEDWFRAEQEIQIRRKAAGPTENTLE